MNFCKDCKFWEHHRAWHKPDADGDCKNPNPLWEAFGSDCSQEGITTAPEFGCVQFEACERGEATS